MRPGFRDKRTAGYREHWECQSGDINRNRAMVLHPQRNQPVNAHQQFEFLILFTNFSRQDLARCIAKLPRRPNERAGQPHYELRLEPEGFYFRDIARSAFSAKMLRVVMELALEHSEVRIEGFGSGNPAKRTARLSGEFARFDALLARYRESVIRLECDN